MDKSVIVLKKQILKSLIPLGLLLVVSGCVSEALEGVVENKANQPIPAKLMTEMRSLKMSPADPILVRIFKKESELEIWKKDKSGRYALLSTYPMCRWSGLLGPKMKRDDRQAPEGFYSVPSSMMNPNSQYFLSFNIGYPNRLERALGYTGDSIVVHGACTSAGCYAMSDTSVAEIYAVARDALKGGQKAFQVQSFPFRMTPKNMATHRQDVNYEFWRDLKRGYDVFEVTKREPKVSTCGGRYVIDADFEDGEPRNPVAPCPAYKTVETQAVAQKRADDDKAISVALNKGNLLSYVYDDGGMHPSFRTLLKRIGPKELAERTSYDDVPVSRPKAALADPYKPL